MFHSCPKLRDLSQKKSALQDVHNLVQTSKEFPEIKFTFADEKFASYVKEGENKRYHEAGSISATIGIEFAFAKQVISEHQLAKCRGVFSNSHSIFGFDISNNILFTSYVPFNHS